MSKVSSVRKYLSMDKDWRFHLGEVLPAVENSHSAFYGFSKAGGADGAARPDWNDSKWKTVDLPHDWALESDFNKDAISVQGYKPRGIGWYRKRFFIPEEDKDKHLILEFEGISTYATIYFNGSILGRSWCGYTSFTVDISDRAFFGKKVNTLAIKVDAEAWQGWWYEGAGIYRHVRLIEKEQLHIAHWGIFANPKKLSNDMWDTEIETTIENSLYDDRQFTLISRIADSEGKCIGTASTEAKCNGGEKEILRQAIKVSKQELWDIDSPKLYTLLSEIYVDEKLVDIEETKFGYRTIRICPDTGFYLNERHVKIKGTCNHQDHAGIGVALPDSIHEYRIERLKEMGSNAYRCAHGNPAPELLDACDRLGMLVMDETRVFESSPEGLGQVESMVRRDRNHPSVIMYSIFNEEGRVQGNLNGRRMAERIKHAIKRLDNTRFVTAALNGGFLEDDGTATVLEVTGFNYAVNTYDAFHKKYPDQPIIGSENNCAYSTRGVYENDVEKQVFSSYDDNKASWGQLIRETWKAVNTRPFVMGLFIWTGFDYRGEPTPYIWPSISSHWGVMDTCGFPKDAFYLHKAYFTEKPIVHIVPHWNWNEGQLIKVMCHTNCEEVELFLNGASLGRKSSPIYEQAEWQVEYKPGILKMVGYRNGSAVAEDKAETSGKPAALKLEPWKSSINGDGLDDIPINISAVDSEGRFVPTCGYKVKFSVSGSGRVIGTGNGDPNSHEKDVSMERSLFNGRCQVILQSLEGTGDIEFTAYVEEMEPSKLTIMVIPKLPPESVTSIYERFLDNWYMTADIFSDKPNPNMKISDSDMNSWERIEIGSGVQKKMDGESGYAVYRTSFHVDIQPNTKPPVIHFDEIIGTEVEVYINGEKMLEKDCYWPSYLEVPLEARFSGKVELSVIIKGGSMFGAGISKSVILK